MSLVTGNIVIKKYKNNNLVNPVQEIEVTNLITKRTILRILEGRDVFNSSLRIAISTSSLDEDYNNLNLINIIAIGGINPSSPVYTYIEESTDTIRYVEYANRFSPPTSNRTFRTIGIVEGVSNNNTNLVTAPCFAYRKLNQLITQYQDETIDIFYRIRFNWEQINNNNLFKSYRDTIEMVTFARLSNAGVSNHIAYGNVYASPIRIPNNINYPNIYTRYETIAFTGMANNNGIPNTVNPISKYSSARSVDTNLLKTKFSAKAVTKSLANNFYSDVNTSTIEFLGRIFASALYGSNSSFFGSRRHNPFYFVDLKRNTEPFQSTISHSAQATGLFYDSSELAYSSWKPNVAGNWNKKLPKLLTLTVTKSGGINQAEYRLKICPYTEILKGFQSKSYTLPWLTIALDKLIHYYASKNIVRDRTERLAQLYSHSCIIIPISQEIVLTCNEVGITLLNLTTGEYTNYNNQSTPQLPCNDITQVSYNPIFNSNLVYIADKQTGLYLLNLNTNTITALSNLPCSGVDIKDNGQVVTILNNKLEISSNNFINKTSYTLNEIPEDNLSFINFIKVEQNVLNNTKVVICLKIPFGTTTSYFTKDYMYWWNEINGVISERSTPTTIISNPASVGNVSDFITGGHACSRTNSIVWNRKDQVWIYRFSRDRIAEGSNNYKTFDTYAIAYSDLVNTTLNLAETINRPIQNNPNGIPRFQSSGFNISVILLNEENELIIPHGIYRVKEDKTGFDLVIGRNPENTVITDPVFFDYSMPGSADSDVCYLGQGLVFFGFNLIYMYPYNYEPSFRIGVVKSWNSITGTFEDSINQIDKTLHTNTINLPEGLTLNWSDLNPSNSVNLIKNQFYTQVISYGIVSDGYEGDIPFDFFYTLRPIKIVNINITLNSSGQFLIPGAPTSNTPDNMFWAIESTDTYIYKLKINNIDVANILSQSSTLSPAPGQLKVLNSSSGIIQYNTSDSGKVLTGTMSYYCKIHTTEV